LWDFEFLPLKDFKDEPRPAKYAGQRRQTAWQVERAIYDDILLKHAAELGCEIHEQAQVRGIEREDDRVTGLKLRDGRRVAARWYIDASGHVGVLRKAMGVNIDVPTRLQNIAIWDYWDDAEWAIEIGTGGTRIQIMSQSDGWMWFIPIAPTRVSLGFVCPAERFKAMGKSPKTLYSEVVRQDERISRLIAKAKSSGEIRTTKDWSFVSERCFGENWFLVGEAAGFADPILSAGLTLTHTGARELAYTILEIDRLTSEPEWLKSVYCQTQRARVRQHIRFADYWYAVNGQFTDLKDHCAAIARDSGMPMAPDAAWRWIAQGGFTNDVLGQPVLGGTSAGGVKEIIQLFSNQTMRWQINDHNVFKVNLAGATEAHAPSYVEGRIDKVLCYRKGDRLLPLTGIYARVIQALQQASDIATVVRMLQSQFKATLSPTHANVAMESAIGCLEVMVAEGWVTGELDKSKPRLQVATPSIENGRIFHLHDPREEQRM
jgi:flavin-dependent dehydrogenase